MRALVKSNSLVRPLAAKLRASEKAAIADIPAANPSMLSSRFIAFVMPMTQKTVSQISTISKPVSGSFRPDSTRIPAPINCPISF